MAASPPTPDRMTAVLHKVLAAVDRGDDLDMDPALRHACSAGELDPRGGFEPPRRAVV